MLSEKESLELILENYPYSKNMKLISKSETEYFFEVDFTLTKDVLTTKDKAIFLVQYLIGTRI